MKIGENTEFKLELKTIISIIVLTSTFMGMYYTLQGDIEEAKALPPAEIPRLEYDLKEQWNEEHINRLEDRVNLLEECCDILSKEVELTSAMLKDGSETSNQFDILNKQLEELRSQKPKTTVIVKEVPTPWITISNSYRRFICFI